MQHKKKWEVIIRRFLSVHLWAITGFLIVVFIGVFAIKYQGYRLYKSNVPDVSTINGFKERKVAIDAVDLGTMTITKHQGYSRKATKTDMLLTYLLRQEEIKLFCKGIVVRGKATVGYKKINPAYITKIRGGRFYLTFGRSTTDCYIKAIITD